MGKWFPMLLGKAKAKASSQTGGFVACSDCFTDQGLKLDAGSIGIAESSPCPNCGRTTGRKLGRDHLGVVAHRFFCLGYAAQVRLRGSTSRNVQSTSKN
jgi:hypothetical protein